MVLGINLSGKVLDGDIILFFFFLQIFKNTIIIHNYILLMISLFQISSGKHHNCSKNLRSLWNFMGLFKKYSYLVKT